MVEVDLVLSTANRLTTDASVPIPVTALPVERIDALADAVGESILNAMCVAETMPGFRRRTVYARALGAISALV